VMRRTLVVAALALVMATGCAALRDGPLTGRSDTIPFAKVANIPDIELSADVCPGNKLYAVGSFEAQDVEYRLFVLIEAQAFTRFMLIDFTAERVWLGEVVKDTDLRVLRVLPLAEVADAYPHPCDFLAPQPKGIPT